jgi:hypothetical protein
VSGGRTDETRRVVGIDTSEDMYDLSIVCASCYEAGEIGSEGSELYEGDEWGGPVPECTVCGGEIRGLCEVPR